MVKCLSNQSVGRSVFGLALGAVLLHAVLGAVAADTGHAHSDDPPTRTLSVAPRAEAYSEQFELVTIVEDGKLVIYLDRYESNEPVDNATLEVTAGESSAVASHDGGGVYSLAADWLHSPGNHDLVFTVNTGNETDLLITKLQLPDARRPTAEEPIAAIRPLLTNKILWASWAAAFLLGTLLAVVILKRVRSRSTVAALAASLVALSVSSAAIAHEGHADRDAETAVPTAGTLGGDSPTRLPDGSIFVPKSTQRLLSVRTVVSRISQTEGAGQFAGLIIADPNHSGRVQSSQTGRVEPTPEGLPYLGQLVERGQVLVHITPLISVSERVEIQDQVGSLSQQIALVRQRLARMHKLQDAVAQREIDEAHLELNELRKRLATIAPSLDRQEILHASATGILSLANVVAGQVVEAKEILYEIVDPTKLWVEALAFEPSIIDNIVGASAVTPEGRVLELTYVGRGLSLRQQAIPLRFRIVEPPRILSIGEPVSVVVRTKQRRSGIVLPRQSLVRGPNGQTLVWDHISAERFVPRPVRIEVLDGDSVLVVAGLSEDIRIVTTGAELLNQIR